MADINVSMCTEFADKKFVTGDYVSDSYTKTKFGANPSTGGFCVNR